jgi:hypothetical protein
MPLKRDTVGLTLEQIAERRGGDPDIAWLLRLVQAFGLTVDSGWSRARTLFAQPAHEYDS